MTARGHGWHQTTVVKTERAEREPRYTELLALGQILRIDLGVLLRPAEGSGPPSWELQALRQEERLLALRAEVQARDLAVLQEQSKDTREQLRRVRRAIKDAEKAGGNTD